MHYAVLSPSGIDIWHSAAVQHLGSISSNAHGHRAVLQVGQLSDSGPSIGALADCGSSLRFSMSISCRDRDMQNKFLAPY